VTAASPTAAFDELVIETRERVELYYTRARIGNRFLAAHLDRIIQIPLMNARSVPDGSSTS
jgi:hypothetical protein